MSDIEIMSPLDTGFSEIATCGEETWFSSKHKEN